MQDEIARLQAAEEQARSDAYAQQCAAELDAWSRADSIDHLKQVILAAQEAMRVPVKSDDGDVVGYDFDPAAARVIIFLIFLDSRSKAFSMISLESISLYLSLIALYLEKYSSLLNDFLSYLIEFNSA